MSRTVDPREVFLGSEVVGAAAYVNPVRYKLAFHLAGLIPGAYRLCPEPPAT